MTKRGTSRADRLHKHLPRDLWPEADRIAFDAAFAPADRFDDERSPGADLSTGTRRLIETAYRRWLGYVLPLHPAESALAPENRITRMRVAEFVAHLKTTVRDTTVATVLDGLHYAARLIAPRQDWAWLKSVQRRIHAAAIPLDRLDQLQPPSKTLHLGLSMMDEARAQDPDPHHLHDLRYRDGLVIALVSLWPIRRRSIASITVSRHLIREGDQLRINLFPEDTKAHRAETFLVPDLLRPYLEHYLSVTRLGLLRHHRHDALWVSQRGTRLTADAVYQIARRNVRNDFGVPMGLHDFRRAAGTFLAIDTPEMIGIIPAVLQHTNPDMSDRHYKLAGSARASQRYTGAIARYRMGFMRNMKNGK